jgi:hypothetical protein
VTCELAHQDAAYVLGALSPGERSDYQRHLAGCDECATSVRMLAGMPGLLARVPEDVLDIARADDPVPSTLLPALVEEVRRRGRNRAWLVTGLSAAAAVVVIAGSVAIGNALLGEQPATPAAPVPSLAPSTAPATPMYPVRPLPVTAEVSLTSVAWGTRLDLTCTYEEPSGGGTARTWRYALVVQTKDGGTEHIATWVARPGRTFEITGATASPKSEIAGVEVQTPDGETLLRLHT